MGGLFQDKNKTYIKTKCLKDTLNKEKLEQQEIAPIKI